MEKEKLLALLEAFRWSPSSSNEQPWAILIASKEQTAEFDKMVSCLVDANQVWAKNAPLLMITLARSTSSRNGAANRTAQHDAGLAMMSLMIEAVGLGLATHAMGGIHLDKIRETYKVPEEVVVLAAIAIGYPGEAEALPPPLAERELAERKRNALESFVFAGEWGKSAGF